MQSAWNRFCSAFAIGVLALFAMPAFGQLNQGDLVVADSTASGGTIWRVTSTGAVTSYAIVPGVFALAVDASGNVIAGNQSGGVLRVGPGGVVTPVGTVGSGIIGGIVVDAGGDYIVTSYGGSISRMTPAGVVTPIASPGGALWGLGLASNGDFIITQQPNNVLRVTPAGVVTPVATIAGQSFVQGLTVGSDGNFYAGAESPPAVYQITPGGTVATLHTGAPYQDPGEGLAYSGGTLFVPDDMSGSNPTLFLQNPAGGTPSPFVSGAPFQDMNGIALVGTAAPPPGPPADIPVLGPVGLALMLAMLGLFGGVALRRRG